MRWKKGKPTPTEKVEKIFDEVMEVIQALPIGVAMDAKHQPTRENWVFHASDPHHGTDDL